MMITQFALPGCDYIYDVEFMVCNKLLQPLQCILGLDFIVAHKLQLSFVEGSYGLVGPHGCTHLTSWASPSGSFSKCSAPFSTPSENHPNFHATYKAGPNLLLLIVFLSLIVVRAFWLLKPTRGYSNQLGMVSIRDKSDNCSYIIVLTFINTADGMGSVRVINIFDSPIRLYKGQKLAQSQPFFEDISIPTQLLSSAICSNIHSMPIMDPGTLKEMKGATNPQLPPVV